MRNLNNSQNHIDPENPGSYIFVILYLHPEKKEFFSKSIFCLPSRKVGTEWHQIERTKIYRFRA